MLAFPQQRPHSQSVPKRRSSSSQNESIEADARSYRFLLSQMADNINALNRLHRGCLGQMEMLPKVKISKEEQLSLGEQLERIYLKQEEKIIKQAMFRNAGVLKSFEDFCQQFRSVNPKETISNEEYIDHKTEAVFFNRNLKAATGQQNLISVASSPAKRPLSSKGSKSFCSTINNAYNSLAVQVGQIFKMKTITGHFIQRSEKRTDRKLVMSSQRGILKDDLIRAKKNFFKERQQTKRYPQKNPQENHFIFNGSEIVICDGRAKGGEEGEGEKSPGLSQSSKFCTKRIIAMKYSQRKSIDQIQKMQLQNRINMVSCVLAVNDPMPQGYRPKSRCWQNYFN